MALTTPVPTTLLDFSGGFKFYGEDTQITVSAAVDLSVTEVTHTETGVTLTDGQIVTAQPAADFHVPRASHKGWRTPAGSTLGGWVYELSLTITAPDQPTILWAGRVSPLDATHTVTPDMGTITAGPASSGSSTTSKDLPAITRLHSSLANITTAPFDALYVGDSITEGANATAPGKRWVDLIRDRARTKYQPLGLAGGPNYVKAGHTYPTTVPYMWTRVGGAGQEIGNGLYIGGYTIFMDAAGEGASLTFTGTSITVFYNRFTVTGAPTLPVTIDGVAVEGLGPFDTAGVDEAATKVYSGLAPGEHTITVEHTGTDTTKYRVHGALVNNGDENTGWRAWESGVAGSKVFVSALPAFTKQVKKVNPDLVTVYYGTNDYIANTDPALFEPRLADLVEAITANVRPRPTVALLRGYTPKHSGTPVYAWSDYQDAVTRVAEAKGVLLVDLEEPFGGHGATTDDMVAAGLVDTDGVHPTDAGHVAIADAVQKAFLL